MRILKKLVEASKKAFSGGDWVDSGLPGNISSSRRTFAIMGTSVNWSEMAGGLECNAALHASVSWLSKSVNQANPVVKARRRDGAEEAVSNHPLVQLLECPNPYYDGKTLLSGVVFSLIADGNAYLGVERDSAGQVVELCWLPHSRVSMQKEAQSREPFDYWEFRPPTGSAVRVAKADIVQIRMGLDPDDPRYGLAPLKALARQQYALEQGVTYTANILRNFGVVGAIITPSDPNVTLDPQEIADKWNAKTQGDRAGSALVMDVPIQVHYPKATPQDLALETILDRMEADICAVVGVPAQVLGLHSGRLAKTYANMKEAREIAWEETVLPLLNLIAGCLSHALLPEVSLRWERERLTFDVSQIRPLLPDVDSLHNRSRADWMANLIDRATWKRQVGLSPLADDAGVYYEDTVEERTNATASE
ncbi:MAG: phage portal protein [Armatimonadetes bacterium]|nr:phage portal protein [Armatimonadota bacterium]